MSSGRQSVTDATSGTFGRSADEAAQSRARGAALTLTPGALVVGRYRVEETLGSGGMARVYRVTDTTNGRELALKRLYGQGNQSSSLASTLFEREFHTLTQLAHPRVIEVYDFGIDEHGSFYTMELLDGGDLKDKSPCEWRRACALIFDVCSALALVHSRRMVHGDVSPRNVRCTRQGHAKLIDFGALAPVGRREKLVGTPAFAAPELVLHRTVDGRSDLFSLGATLYFALTRQLAYAAREFSELDEAWQSKPAPPSYYVPEIPAALDTLVLDLLALEPAARPRSAFEVMQRLAVLADFRQPEHAAVAQAYLSTPNLIGRDAALRQARAQLERSKRGRGGSLLITGAAGVGRTRMLDACVTSAKTLGSNVVRIHAPDGMALSGADQLLDQLALALPCDLAQWAGEASVLSAALTSTPARTSLAKLDVPPPELQSALSGLVATIAAQYPLVIAVDELQRVDEFSRALFANLAHAARGLRLLLIATQESSPSAPESLPLKFFADVSASIALEPLSLEESHELLQSIFGDVANLHRLNERVFARALGNPRRCLALLQHLVDTRKISYERGAWTLPSALTDEELPAGDAALQLCLLALSPGARAAVAGHALTALDGFTREDYGALLSGITDRPVDNVIGELVAEDLVSVDGRLHRLASREVGRLLLEQLSAAEVEAAHLSLVRMFEQRNTSPLLVVRHQLAAGRHEQAISLLLEHLGELEDTERAGRRGVTAMQFAGMLDEALSAAQALRRPARELSALRHWLIMFSASADPLFHRRVASDWLTQLEHDSGLCYWRQEQPGESAQERLKRALTRAAQVYAETSEAERVYRPDEAIKHLVRYVVASLAVGAKLNDGELLAELPPLLEPFAVLSPVAMAVWQNAIATHEAVARCQVLQARERWIKVLDTMPTDVSGDMRYVVWIRNAVTLAMVLLEARIGLGTAAAFLERLSDDRLQAVNAMYARKIVQLQRGDLRGAEECRKQAELLAIRATSEPLHWSTLVVELIAHAMAKDAQGVKQVQDRITALAQRYAGWVPFMHLAEAHFQSLVGDVSQALEAVDRCIALAAPHPDHPHRALLAWPAAVGLRIELLTAAGREREAVALGEAALVECAARAIDVSAHPIQRATALAQAKLGDVSAARERMDGVLAQQLRLGVEGLQLGASYEVLARIAALAHQRSEFERYAELCGREYRAGSGLSSRYATLLLETRVTHASPLEWMGLTRASFKPPPRAAAAREVDDAVQASLADVTTRAERTQRALELVCLAYPAAAGELYVWDGVRVSRVAAFGAPQDRDADAERARSVERHLERETQSHLAQTRAEGETRLLAARERESFHVLPLRGEQAGREAIAGAVVVFADRSDQRAAPADLSRTLALVRAVADQLLQRGDAQGIAVAASDD